MGIGGQSLGLPWGPNYTIHKYLFDYLLRCLLHDGTKGLTAYIRTLALPYHQTVRLHYNAVGYY
jgi:hypothetical protein